MLQTPILRQPVRRAGLLLGVLLLVPALAQTALPARPGTLDAGQIKETVFPNGLRLLVKESRASDLAAVQVWIRAGGFLENEQTAGTAHVLEHLIFKGSESEGAIDAEIENLGGLLEASTEKDWTRFGCTVSGRHVGRVLTVVADALRRPLFRESALQAEKPVIQEEIDAVRRSPEATLTNLLYSLAYQKHPYRFDVRGTPGFLRRVTLDDTRTYYQRYYQPSNMVVVVVGDVDPAGVERVVRLVFQADQAAAPVPVPIPEPETPCSQPERRLLQGPFNSGYVALAWPAPSVADQPDVHAMDLILTVLELDGIGRLPRALQGIGGVQARFDTRRQAGLLTVLSATGTTNPEQVETLLRREVQALTKDPPGQEELAVAKRTLRGSYALDNETYAGQAGSLGYYAAIDRWQFASEYLAKVEAVTPEQFHSVARRYLSGEPISLVLKGRGVPPAGPRTREDTQ